MSPETSSPRFSNNARTCSLCSVRMSVMRVIALITRGPPPGSSKSFSNILSPLSLRKSLCPMENSLIRDDSAYMAFFLTAIGSRLESSRRSNGKAPCFSAACWTSGLLWKKDIILKYNSKSYALHRMISFEYQYYLLFVRCLGSCMHFKCEYLTVHSFRDMMRWNSTCTKALL